MIFGHFMSVIFSFTLNCVLRCPNDLKTISIAIIIYSQNPTFMPSLSKIGDLSCITSCLVLPGFLMDTLLSSYCFGLVY